MREHSPANTGSRGFGWQAMEGPEGRGPDPPRVTHAEKGCRGGGGLGTHGTRPERAEKKERRRRADHCSEECVEAAQEPAGPGGWLIPRFPRCHVPQARLTRRQEACPAAVSGGTCGICDLPGIPALQEQGRSHRGGPHSLPQAYFLFTLWGRWCLLLASPLLFLTSTPYSYGPRLFAFSLFSAMKVYLSGRF